MWFGRALLNKIRPKDLTNQNYSAQKGNLIYHYCDENAFWSICSKRSMWLSSIFEMNDSKELEWGRQLVIETLEKNKKLFPQEFRLLVISNVFNTDSNILPVLASFSQDGDLLSQWRAYGNDAKGFSIGFCGEAIAQNLPVSMKKVSYNQNEQSELIFNSLNTFYKYWKKYRGHNLHPLRDVLTEFAFDLSSFKHPSFFEEKEIRIIHLLVRDKDKEEWVDPGGHNIKSENISGTSVLTRGSNNMVNYIDMPLLKSSCIKKVILGSKNNSSVYEVKEKLNSIGLMHVQVEKSHCTYI